MTRIVPLEGSIKVGVGIGDMLRMIYPKAHIWQKILIKLYLTLESVQKKYNLR